MVSKNNVQLKDRYATKQVPHYGIRKLSVGVSSVLLSTTLYMGVTAHADTTAEASPQPTVDQPASTTADTSTGDATSDMQSKSTADQPASTVTGTSTDGVTTDGQLTADQTASTDTSSTALKNDVNTSSVLTALPKHPANTADAQPTAAINSMQPVMDLAVKPEQLDVQPTNTLDASPETTKPATAWQPEPTTNYSADHTAKIDMTNQPTTVHGDNWQMSLDKNYIKAGQGATLTVKYEAQAGDTFVLDVGYPANSVNAQSLNNQIGTTSTKNNGLRTQVINVFKQAGTYTQIIKLNDWKISAEGLKLLRHVFGDQAFDLTLKRGTSAENAQDVGRLYLTSNFTPTMTGDGSVGVDRIDTKYVPVLSTNNNYIFSVRTNWSDSGTALEPSYNGDFVYSISVPKTFELDQAATEALYQQIHSNELYGNWGVRGSNVTVSQAGVGAPVIIKATALDWVAWHYSGNEGVSFLGHFVDAPSVATTVTAEGQTTVSDTIGNHTQTIILPGLSAKVINASDYNYADSSATVFSVSDYGDHNQLYQSHEVPMTGSGNPINLINDLALVNNSPFDVKHATITVTFGDGLHVEVNSVRNNSYISNLLADNYTSPNREKSFLVTYQDGTSEMVSANSKGDLTKNIKSITLTRDWNASQMAGLHGGGIHGFVAKTYQDGSPVKVGDTINVSLTVAGVNTAGHNVSKTVHDTLKVVDQQFAPLTTVSYWDGVHTTGLGDNPSGTVDVRWNRTSGERGKIQLENPTIYFVMPNTVSQIKNPRWGSGKDVQGNAAPMLTSITYEKSKDGKNTVAIMHFSGSLIDQVPNQYVPIIFDTVNKDNVVNQASEGYFYWTADNVNTDGLTKIDPTRADSQNKSAHLPADLSQEQLSKIYLHSPYWGKIDMATGMYSTSATKTATTPWQTQTVVDYHGDGQADVGVNLVNDTSNELHNVVAIINLPKASNDSNLTVNLTGNNVELIDPNTNSKLTDGVTVLYSTKPADLSSNDLSSFVTADQIKDWSKVQAVAVTLQKLGGMTSRQVQIPVVVNDLVANAGKSGTVGTRISADELKPIIVSADAENAAKLVVGGQATIHVQMHYQDAQGKDYYVPLTNPTHAYDIFQHHVLNSSDFTPSTTDLAQVPGYELSKASPTVVSGHAVIGQPVLAPDDGSVLQFELVPSAQKVLINYVDDDDNQKVIKTDTLTGKTGETHKINIVIPDNYVLVDPADNPSEYTFLASDNKPITIHLNHATHSISDSRTVTETVHYQAADGSQVPSDHLAKANFSRTGTHDEVTGTDHWNAWNISSYDFNAVPTPVKTGYTPDVQTVSAETVTPESDSIRKVVTYTPDAQKLSVRFIDDTTGQVLKTVAKTGVTNAAAGYNTQSDIQSYEGQHYVLVSDSSHGASLVFDNNDSVDQAYEVHLKHGTHQINEHHTITQTVHYIATDHAGVPDDHTVSVQFDRDGYHDEVTGADHWNAWNQGGTQTFIEVPTPKKAGYTPDKSSVPATVVYPSDHNQTITVTYTPDTQKVIVTFIDDTDNGKTLKTVTKTGPTNSGVGYTTGDDINLYKGQHYVLVSDQTHGQSITFDTDTNTDQRYEVHLRHATHRINDHRTITETVHYKMGDGTTAPVDYTAKIEFSRDGFNDEVTGADHWNAWTPSATHQFDAVQSPLVKGYTPDIDKITAVTVNPDSQNIDRTVTYSPNIQIAHVKYIDDTDHKVLTQDDLNGRTGETSDYHTSDRITEFKGQHYDLVSDTYPVNGMTFDNNDRVDQIYEVHFKHATRTDEQDVQVPRTIKYVYQNGQPAQLDHTDALSFHETKVVDLVDGHTVSDNWTPVQDFKTIETPAIQGYTSDHASVSNAGIAHDHSVIVETVTYNPDAQKAVVKYIDDTTGEQLEAKYLTGVSDQSTGYSTRKTIDGYVNQHYVLVSDGTHGETVVFDHDDDADQAYEVHLKHATAPVTDHRAKDLTVHYVYANGQARTGKAADDQTAPELTFNRTGVQDLVTNNIAWNAWDHVDQTFTAIKSPAIQGYTPDRVAVDNVKVNPDADESTEVTVIYHADAQKLTVNFIDDVTGQTLKTVAKTGYSDGDAGYNTKADIQTFAGQHYDLVSDVTKGAELVFDHDDSVDQVYDVHLTHHLTPISDHQVVNETIHYVYADGLARTGKAADDYVATPLEFNRTGKHDDVTGTDAWDAWIPGSASFVGVQSPAVQGYTPDQSQVDVIAVNANSQDIVKTVTYSADQQKMTIDFIDDTDNRKVLKTVTKTGRSDEAVDYNTKGDIQTFVDGHYKLDHDTSNGENLVFDHDDVVDQHYEVHLTHETAPISEATSTNQVIHYQLADGTPVTTDYTAKVDFSRNGFKDLVTNADHWNAWTPNATQTFDAVVSPVKAGYTPDHAQVDAVTVEPHHADLETTVTYSPDAQKAAVKYIDDVTGETLQTKELTGVSDETSTYTTESTIKQYVGQHYKLVSDQTNGKPVVFDHDDGSNQTFEVYLTHTYQSVSQEHQVHQTIHYQYVDGKQARPDYTAPALAFSRTGTQDLVTDNIQWNAWTPDQVFAAVNTPAVNGYTPDVQTVAPVKVSHDSKDIEQTVVYHADDQTILVNYIDDDTHSTLKTDSIIGKTVQTSDYTTKNSLDQYKGQHYDLVSDDTNGDTLTFDSDSTKVQTYNVHLKHQHQAASDKSTVHQTVHYVYQDGKQAAKDHTATPIEFTRTGDTDLVTGKTTWNAWTPATGTFVAVLSPVIDGYTPSRAMIDHVDVYPGDKNLDTTVTYVPDRQVIVVNYIDQTTGKTLKTDTLNGLSDQTSGYTTKSQIDSYLGQHYKLISDATNGQTLTFDHDDQATQTYDVVLGHQTEEAHRTHEVRETVDYVYADGSQVAKSFTAQPLVFSQTGVHDLVTNTTDWNGEWTKPQVFVAVESPKIVGFTASKPEVKAVEVTHQSSDVHELVIYAANAQTAQIKYIDDVTGKTLETDGANGHFNESIVFSHNVNDQINKFKQAHYKLVSNNFDGQKYQADNTENVYEVHLIHKRQNVHATDAVTETVEFQYADGSQAQPTKTQTVNFGRDGVKDLVTGTTAWMPVDPQTIGAVNVPVIDGYTADIDQVPAVKVNFGDQDITKVVTYTANDQNAGIKIIDDTTGKVLNMQVANGKFGTEIQFKQNPDQQVIDLQAQHYELVSDNFKHQKYQADNEKNQFEIHVKHQMMDVQRTGTVTETVCYQDNHGNMLHPVTTQTKMFTEHGITDQVTGKTVWTPAKSQTMDVVSVPEITGYTPNKQSVPATTVNFGDKDINEVIVYTPVSETANIKYIDDTTGKTLLSDQVTGDFGTQIKFDHDPVVQINQYEGQGYKLVSNSYGKTVHQFSATSGENNFEVHFKHGTMSVIDTDTVTETIHYLGPDGNKLAPDKTQTITFTRHGIKDQVTGQIDWNSVEPQEFNAVKSPVINGYATETKQVPNVQVKFGDENLNVDVVYHRVVTPPVKTPTSSGQPGKTSVVTSTSVAGTLTGQTVVSDKVATPSQTTSQDPAKISHLPQTGNESHSRLALAGLALLGLTAGLFGFGKKKHQDY